MNLINMLQMGQEMKDSYTYIFDDILIPEGLDKEVLINTILDKSALHEPITSDPDLMKMKVENLFKKNYDIYTRLYKAFKAEYEPLENYDRYEDWDESGSVKGNSTDNSTLENQVSAYDASTYQPSGLSKSDGTTNSESESKAIRKGHVHGNIGVMSAQEMLEKELAVRPKLNIYEIIANDFFNNLMICVFD